jgi:hypothetical protein
MMAFIALKNTLSDLPKWVWRQVAVGNVYELYSLVIANFSESGREVIVDDLATRLANFAKLKSENFVQFVARFEQLVSEIKEAGMDIDTAQLVNSAERAIIDSGDEALNQVYQMWTMAQGKGRSMTDPLKTFKEMEPNMLFEERKSRRKGRKGKGSEEASRETALRAGTWAGKSSKSTSSGKKILGVCHYFQTDKGCHRGDSCCFEHKKLSNKAAKELKSRIDSRRKEKNSSAENSSAENSSADSSAENSSAEEEEKSNSPPVKKRSESAKTKMARTKRTARKLTQEEISRIADELEQRRESSD